MYTCVCWKQVLHYLHYLHLFSPRCQFHPARIPAAAHAYVRRGQRRYTCGAMPIYVFLPAHQERFESLEIFCQLDALLGSFHEGFQFRRDLDICLQYLIDRSFEFGGMGGLEE